VWLLRWLDRASALGLLAFGGWLAVDLVDRASAHGPWLLVPAAMAAVSTLVLIRQFRRDPGLGFPLSWLRRPGRRGSPAARRRRTVGSDGAQR
jgi:hypothetical protein